MRKVDLAKRVDKVDKKLLALANSGRRAHLELLTCRDLERLIKAFETIYEIFDGCMIGEEEDEKD